MKRIVGWFCLAIVLMAIASVGAARPDEGDRRLMERLERLEQQVHRLTAMQERTMDRLGRPDAPRPPLDASKPPIPPPPSCPMASKCARSLAGLLPLLFLLAIVINIILAVWVYHDVRKRGEGRGIFIVLVLLAGLPAAILYALVRLGDRVGEKPS